MLAPDSPHDLAAHTWTSVVGNELADAFAEKAAQSGAQSRKGLIPAEAQGSRAAAFLWLGLPAVDVWRSAVWAFSDGSSNTSKAGSAGVLHAGPWQMSHVTARPGDGGA